MTDPNKASCISSNSTGVARSDDKASAALDHPSPPHILEYKRQFIKVLHGNNDVNSACAGSIPCDNSACGSTDNSTMDVCTDCCTSYFCSKECQQCHCGDGMNIDNSNSDCHATIQKIQQVSAQSMTNISTDAAFSMDFSFATVVLDQNDPRYPSKENCSICLESFDRSNDDEVNSGMNSIVVLQGTSCRHPFCLSCILKWNRYGGTSSTTTPMVLPRAESFTAAISPTQFVPIVDCGIRKMNFPLPPQTMIDEKLLCCPICRAKTQDLEQCLLRRTMEICQHAKQARNRGSPPTPNTIYHLEQAERVVAALLSIENPYLQGYYIQAEIKLEQGEVNKSLTSLETLVQEDRWRHEIIHGNAVLSRIECARDAYNRNDYPNMMLALKAAIDEADRSSCPPVPPPCLRGGERQQIYRLATLLRAEVYTLQKDWMRALSALRKVLASEKEMVAKREKQDGLYGEDEAIMAKIWKLIAVSTYHIDAFDASIDASRRCLQIDRTMSGDVYRTLLLSTLKSGIDKSHNHEAIFTAARRVLRDAILYEAPWDMARFLENRNHHESLNSHPEASAFLRSLG